MKISIGSKIVDGPWGGGNLFLINLSNYLINQGHEVVYDLGHKDIDLILLTDPRKKNYSTSTFNHLDIKKYKNFVNRDVNVVQRINECDERKRTNNVNKLYFEASLVADHIIFVSDWLRDIYVNLGMEDSKTSTVLSGSNPDIFNSEGRSFKKTGEKFKVVTHHWSNNYFKGYQIYKKFDDLLNDKKWSNLFEFSYIGNVSQNFDFKNTNVIDPLSGKELANELKKNHIYLTASINEPSGNHHIEASQCGLPVLYLKSGGIPEYCKDFGIGFDQDFEDKLLEMATQYDYFFEKIELYPHNSEKMSKQYFKIFTNLYDKRSHQNLNSKFLANIYILKIKISNFIIFKIISKFVLFKEKLKKLLKILIKPFVS